MAKHLYRDVILTVSLIALDADSEFGPATGIGNMHMERHDGEAATIEQVINAAYKAAPTLVMEALEQLNAEAKKADGRESGNEGLN